ncbi:hypothetical protein F5887DRAFT_966294 [Amanita rubescens]|nr:hypothetical protein F5887DRAFT_966294 [Amanita rubescens]
MSVRPLFNELRTSHPGGKIAITHFYCLARMAYIPVPRPLLDRCQVQRVTIYKQREHYNLLVKRTVKRTVNLASILKLRATNRKLANDTALEVDIQANTTQKLYGDARVIWILATDGTFSMNLMQLATLLRSIVVDQLGQRYHTVDRNCFWFARMTCLAIACLARRQGAQDRLNVVFTDEAETRLECGCVRNDGSIPHGMDEVENLVNGYERKYQEFLDCYYPQGKTTSNRFSSITSMFSHFTSTMSI